MQVSSFLATLGMELTGKSSIMLLWLFLSFSCFVHGTVHHHKHQHHHQHVSIAVPPSVADAEASNPPAMSPQTAVAGSSGHSSNTPPNCPLSSCSNGSRSANATKAHSPSPLPSLPAAFDVLTFGAIGDGIADDTEAFVNAWDSACESVGSGVVHAPSGYSFMIRPTIFAGPCSGEVVFQVDGVLMPPDGPDSWPSNASKIRWLVFYKADGMSLTGAGLVDGRGQKWWDLPCKPHKGINSTTSHGKCDSPVAMCFFRSSNLRVYGLKFQNSPQFHLRFDECDNVNVDSITIKSPAHSPNTDGIHISKSKNVEVHNSVVSTGDDCISIASGSFNVYIQNATCGPSHGISIGSLGQQKTPACVANVTVRNSVVKHSDNGVRIKTWEGGRGSVSGVIFDGIMMDTVRNPIIIDQYYCLCKPCANRSSAVYISNVLYSNISGTYDDRSPPVHLACSDTVPCTNIALSNVNLLPAQGGHALDAFCWNAYGVMPKPCVPPIACLLEGLPRSMPGYEADSCF